MAILNQEVVEELFQIFNHYEVADFFHGMDSHTKPIVKKIDNGYEIQLDDDHHFPIKGETFFYNWLRTPLEHLYNKLDLNQRYIGDIYQLPKSFFNNNELKSIIVLGYSLTIPWIIRDFPGVKVYMIKTNDDDNIETLFKKIPRNSNIFSAENKNRVLEFVQNGGPDSKLLRRGSQEYRLARLSLSDTTAASAATIFPTSKNEGAEYPKAYSGYFFTGRGLRTETEITKDVSKENKLELPSKEQLAEENSLSGKWIAPKNIPFGSLPQSFLNWMSETGNIKDCYELQLYHQNNFRFTIFRPEAQKFYDIIGNRISERDSPSDQIEEVHKVFEEGLECTTQNIMDSIRKYPR